MDKIVGGIVGAIVGIIVGIILVALYDLYKGLTLSVSSFTTTNALIGIVVLLIIGAIIGYLFLGKKPTAPAVATK